jgi:hypothetical protein
VDTAANLHATGATSPCGDDGKGRTPPRPLPMRDVKDCKRAVAKLINECRAGTIHPKVASVCLYGCNIMLAAIAAGDFEDRLTALEQRTPT